MSATTVTTLLAAPPAVKVEALTGSGKAPHAYEYRVELPQVAGQSAMNDVMRAWAKKRIVEFVAVVEEDNSGTGESESQRSNLTGRSATTLVDRRVVSFRLVLSQYISGAAHPGAQVKSFTFDLTTGKELALPDLFKPGAPYLNYLSRRALEQLKASEFKDDLIEEGASARDPNFASYNLTDKGMEVTFQEYQVGPYAIGTPTVKYTYAELRPLMGSSGPLAGR